MMQRDSYDIASLRGLSQDTLYSVEYPGYIEQESIPFAINHLGGSVALNTAFKRSASRKDSLLELNFRPGNASSHPVPGSTVSSNSLLLKIVKRKYKQVSQPPAPLNPYLTSQGAYTASIVGIIGETARFRSMADYQFMPDSSDPLVTLQRALEQMNVAAIKSYTMPDEDENYYNLDEQGDKTGNLRVFSPPSFGRQNVPQLFNYKSNPTSIPTTVVDEKTGVERKRLVNRQRWKGWAPISITYVESVPIEPPLNAKSERQHVNPTIMEKLNELFTERPIWTRVALLNQFSVNEARELTNTKFILPLVCYVFQDGPWRDTFVRLGHDPRVDPSSRIYQRLYFRNLSRGVERTSIITRRTESRYDAQREKSEDRRSLDRRSHIFDGRVMTTDTASFQLCDLHDSMLRNMVMDLGAVRETCNERDGWYQSESIERIKSALRHKFFCLLDGVVVSDADCEAAILTEGTAVARGTTFRSHKHNRAKGALPPEEAAAARLRSILGSGSNSVKDKIAA